jgi:hypothetical protein
MLSVTQRSRTMQTITMRGVALALVLLACSAGATAQPPSGPIVAVIVGNDIADKLAVQTWTLDVARASKGSSELPLSTLSVERVADHVSLKLVDCFVNGCELKVVLYSGQTVVTMEDARIVEYRQMGVAGRSIVNTERVLFEGRAVVDRVP